MDNEKEFVIDTSDKADWAIEQIKQEQERFEIYEQTIKNKISDLKEKLDNETKLLDSRTSWLKYKLNQYLDTVPAKETKTQKSFKLPSGSIVRKFEQPIFITHNGKTGSDVGKDAELLNWCKENNLTDEVKVAESVDWKGLKSNLEITGDMIIYKPTGEICNALDVTIKPMEVEVK